MIGSALIRCSFTPILFVCAVGLVQADEGTDFFENHIRPVLAERCYGCHSSKQKAPQGDFYADSKEGLLKGGKSGPRPSFPENPRKVF